MTLSYCSPLALKSLIFSLILLSIGFEAYTQDEDVIYTIKAEVESESTHLDSILFENLTTGKRLLFEKLPIQDQYKVNLRTHEMVGIKDIFKREANDAFIIVENRNGLLRIRSTKPIANSIALAIYTADGKKVFIEKIGDFHADQDLTVRIPIPGIYVVVIHAKQGQGVFKTRGSNENGSITYSLDYSPRSFSNVGITQARLKNRKFDFEKGDSIRLSVYLGDYYTYPKGFNIKESESHNFIFSKSQVDQTGISDSYFDISNQEIAIRGFNADENSAHVTILNDTIKLQTGDIITLDLDTTGVIQRVVERTVYEDSIVIKTENAYMQDLFVGNSFKLSTELIEPRIPLKSTSSNAEIMRALTDNEGYIHPDKIIFYDENNNIIRKSTLKFSQANESKLRLLDLEKEYNGVDLIGKSEDRLHFYMDEARTNLSLDAVFEFDFGVNKVLSEYTKVKKGDLNSFEFYLEGNAEIMSKLVLRAKDEFVDEQDIELYDMKKVSARFIVPPSIPVWITFECDIEALASINITTGFTAQWGFESEHSLQVGGTYTKATGKLEPFYNYTPTNKVYPLKLYGEFALSSRLEIYPEIDVKFYNFFGPHVEIAPYLEGSYEGALTSQITSEGSEKFVAWDGQLDLGLDLRVGTELTFLDFWDNVFGPHTIECFKDTLWYAPDTIYSQESIPKEVYLNEELKIEYKVEDLHKNPVDMAPVYISDGKYYNDSRKLLLTNNNGFVSLNWVPNSTGEKIITATLYNAKKNIKAQQIDTINVSINCNVKDLDAWWNALDDESKKVYNHILKKGEIVDKPSQDELESFCGMMQLSIPFRNLTHLNGLEVFTSLRELDVSRNKLKHLDLSKCKNLTYVNCHDNDLEYLDVSGCARLTRLDCGNNQLSSLDVSSLVALTLLNCNSNQLTALNISNNVALTHLDCGNNQLSSLDVSSLVALTLLDCNSNQLTALNISNNVALTRLDCGNNQLSSLNVSNCTQIEELNCDKNKITSLDVGSLVALSMFDCNSNQLSSLDVSNSKLLTELNCNFNQLTDLNVSNCAVLSKLGCSQNQLSSLNVDSLVELIWFDCSSNQLTSLDVSKCIVLGELRCISNQLTTLNFSKNIALYTLYCHSNQLSTLDVSKCTELVLLNCNTNQLTNLNVSNNLALTKLSCEENQLSTLDVSNLKELYKLDVRTNPLTYLNVSGCSALSRLYIIDEQLTTLIANDCSSLTKLNCSGNQLSTLNVSNCGALSSFSCQENQLTTLDVSSLVSLTSLDCSSNQLTTLDVSSLVSLTNLDCSSNQLSTLDVSSLVSLTNLDCSSNQLSTLDVSNCTALIGLDCYSNQLTTLDVNDCIALSWIKCYSNHLSTLNASNISALVSIDCRWNQFSYESLRQIFLDQKTINIFWSCDNASYKNGPDPNNPREGSDCNLLEVLYQSTRN